MAALSVAMSTIAPDHDAIWTDNHAALGCRLLRTTPESLVEELPYEDPESGLVLTADARLDNRTELIARLEITDRQLPDSEILMLAYKKWGDQCCVHLHGDFAFVVWNPHTRTLFCACDQIGARSIGYYANRDFFAFATDPEALVVISAVAANPDEVWLASLLYPQFRFDKTDRTPIDKVSRLEAGKYLKLTSSGYQASYCYWTIQEAPEIHYGNENHYIEAFTEIFEQAVTSRIRSLSTPALMVSGGIDTAAIVGALTRINRRGAGFHMPSFSAVADEPSSCIETRCILSLTAAEILEPHYLHVPSLSGISTLQDVLEVVWSAPHPVANNLLLNQMMVRSARKAGANVVIHGVNGDLAQLDPTDYIAPILRQRHWRRAWHECRQARQNHNYISSRAMPTSILARNLYAAFMPLAIKRGISKVRYLHQSYHLNAYINPELAKRTHLDDRLRRQMEDQLANIGNGFSSHFAQGMSSFGTGLRGYNRVGYREGVEMRDPWSDKRVIEFFYRLPLEFNVREGWTKYLARKAYTKELDSSVRWRKGKEHLGFHFHKAAFDGGSAIVADLFENQLPQLEPYVDTERLMKTYSSAMQGSTSDAGIVYFVATIGLWLDRLASHQTT